MQKNICAALLIVTIGIGGCASYAPEVPKSHMKEADLLNNWGTPDFTYIKGAHKVLHYCGENQECFAFLNQLKKNGVRIHGRTAPSGKFKWERRSPPIHGMTASFMGSGKQGFFSSPWVAPNKPISYSDYH